MLRIGTRQKLVVVKKVDFGVYLAEEMQRESERVLLPRKQVPVGITEGMELEVFLYKDSEDRLIATTNVPRMVLGEFGVLRVVSVSKLGAFLDWGLEKDLFLPYREQLTRVKEGQEVLVRLYVDKSERLCASMRGLYEMLATDSSYQKGDVVSGRVYEFSDNFGAFVAVDDKYSALIPAHEDHRNLHIGEVIQAEVVEVKPDGKLTLTQRKKAYLQMEEDAQKVVAIIESYAGVLPFNDKAPAEIIMREVGLSKAAFKRAVGLLYKERKIIINERSIRLV